MCKCLLILPFLIACLCTWPWTKTLCEDEVADLHQHDVSIIIQEPNSQQVTSDLDGGQGGHGGSRIRQWPKKLLWTRKRSHGSSTSVDKLDSLDMQDWLETGLPSVEYSILSSPSNCCAEYSMTLKGAEGSRIRLVILDLYLLPGSSLRIENAEGGSDDGLDHPSTTPTMAQSIENILHITIDQPETAEGLVYQTRPSFTAIYWEVPEGSGEWKRRPYAQCPAASAAMFGGQVFIGDAPVAPDEYIYDCVWVIQKPRTSWPVYIRIIELHLPQGLLEIRDGIHSTSSLIISNGNNSSLESLDQPEVGFWSSDKEGLYMRIVKPINEGYLTFVYGVARESKDEHDNCNFDYHGFHLTNGWNCIEPSMCIPLNHTCNGVSNCPYGEDELDCNRKTNYDACEHEFEKRCPKSRGCVHRTLEFCPEEKCPGDRLFRCDYFTKCYSKLEKCNGLEYCDDGKDERGCPKKSKGLSTKTIVIIVCVSGLFTILPSVILCCWDDPVERDLQRAQEAFTNLCDLYSGRTLLSQIQAARRAGTLGVDPEARSTNHRPTYPVSTNQEEVILLNPQDQADNQHHTSVPVTDNSHLAVPVGVTASPRRPPHTLPILNSQTDPCADSPGTDSSSPPVILANRDNNNSSPEYNNIPLVSSSNASHPNQHHHQTQPTTSSGGGDAGRVLLSPPPYLLQPDVAALERPASNNGQNHDLPPYLIPPGGATADGLPPDTEGPPPYESVQLLSPTDPTKNKAECKQPNPPAYSH